jgi:alpha-beta hydrolase superfamily lysophospholipase
MQHKEGNFPGYKNLNLYYQSWLPDKDQKAILLVVHGLAEHSGRYSSLAHYFVTKGYTIYALDQRGHGKSEGLRCYIERFSDYLDDLKVFSDFVHSQHRGIKVFLIGHSMGGTIATAFATNHQDGFAGLVLSGASLKAGSSITWLQIVIARLLSTLLPKMGVAVIDASAISRNKAVVDAYVNDPLVYRGKIRARLGAELINVMQKELPRKMREINLPILIMYGTADRLSNPEGSNLLYELVKSNDKTLKRYEGWYHEIFNEPEHEQVWADVEEWLAHHV